MVGERTTATSGEGVLMGVLDSMRSWFGPIEEPGTDPPIRETLDRAVRQGGPVGSADHRPVPDLPRLEHAVPGRSCGHGVRVRVRGVRSPSAKPSRCRRSSVPSPSSTTPSGSLAMETYRNGALLTSGEAPAARLPT